MCYSLNVTKKLENEKLENGIFAYIVASTHVFINNPNWQNSGIIIFLCKYDIVISDTLVDFFLNWLFLLLILTAF